MRAKGIVSQSCANVLLACARLQYRDARLVHHMTRCLVKVLTEAKPQDLSNSLYALGELREDCGHVPRPEDLRQLVGANAQRLRGGEKGEVGEAAAVAFKPQEVSNMLLGCAKLGMEDGEAVQLLAAAAGAVAVRMKGQELANSVWALGKLLGDGGGGGDSAVAIMGLLQEVRRRMRPSSRTPATTFAFAPQHLSILLYGVALLQPYILRAAETEQGDSKRSSWKAGVTAAAEALAGEYKRRSFEGFEPRHVANAAWALAQLCHSDQGWFAAAVAAAQRPAFASTAIPMHWTQLWSALALVRHRPPPELAECTARAVAGHIQRLDSQTCSVLLWSFAVLGVWEERLAGVVLGRLAELVERGQGQEVGAAGVGGAGAGSDGSVVVEQALANALWAVAVAGPGALAAHSREVGVLLREAARRWEQGASFNSEQFQQLWQVQLELQAMGGWEDGGPAPLSTILRGACRSVAGGSGGAAAAGTGTLLAAMERAADEGRLGGATTESTLQREVAGALRRLQLQQQQQQHEPPRARSLGPQGSEQEGQAEGGAAASGSPDSYRSFEPALAIRKLQLEPLVPALRSQVDVLVEWSDGRVVAVEVDGPVHYMRNSPYKHTKDGPTALRDRQLGRVFGQGNVVCERSGRWCACRTGSGARYNGTRLRVRRTCGGCWWGLRGQTGR